MKFGKVQEQPGTSKSIIHGKVDIYERTFTMYKRSKRPRPGELIVGKPFCASTGPRENVVDESSVTTSNNSDVETSPKAKLTVFENAATESTNFDNLFDLLLDCGMDISEEPSNVLSQ